MLGRDKSVIQQGIIATTDHDDWSGVEKEAYLCARMRDVAELQPNDDDDLARIDRRED